MLITPEEIGRRLRFARESRQITQETSSTVLGLQRSAISLMEFRSAASLHARVGSSCRSVRSVNRMVCQSKNFA